jgi:glycosyl transferase family 25
MDQTWQNQLNGFFDKIFVITIERAKERQIHIREEFKGLNFEFFVGTDKFNLNYEDLVSDQQYDDKQARRVPRYQQSLSLGEIACSMSHRGVYEQIVKNGYQRTLIFEDDVQPMFENMTSLADILREWPEDSGIVYLGYWRRENWKLSQKVKTTLYLLLHRLKLWGWHRFTANRVRHLYIRPHSHFFNKAGFHDGAHAYAVSLEAAKKLLETQTPVAHSADHLLNYVIHHLEACSAYVSRPKLFTQASHVEPDRLSSIREDV